MESWARAFALTQLVELPLYLWLLSGLSIWRRLGFGFAASALTHPWLWFILPNWLLRPLGYWGYVAVGEGLVVLTEAALLKVVCPSWRRALAIALLANGCSFGVGLLVF